MIVIPREIPVISGLNSYYIDGRRLIEHYQGELDAGCVFYRTLNGEGAVFFDEESILNGVFYEKKKRYKGPDAIERLVKGSGKSNFSMTVYEIPADRVSYWANFAEAESLFSNISTENTDLDEVIGKLVSKKFNGYVAMDFSSPEERGMLYFISGIGVASSLSVNRDALERAPDHRQMLVARAKEQGAVFHIRKIPLGKVPGSLPVASQRAVKERVLRREVYRTLEMLEQLLIVFDKTFTASPRTKTDFPTALRRKFMEKIGTYDFLDPFAAEFIYGGGKLSYTGRENHATLVAGVADSLREMAIENGIGAQLKKNLIHWEEKYARETAHFEVCF